jgi:hypothetical protein
MIIMWQTFIMEVCVYYCSGDPVLTWGYWNVVTRESFCVNHLIVPYEANAFLGSTNITAGLLVANIIKEISCFMDCCIVS